MTASVLGFVGVGVMGEPMCRNLKAKSGLPVLAFDLAAEPLQRLAAHGVESAPDLAAVAARADVVFLSLPGGPQLERVAGQLLASMRAGQALVDTTTAPLALTRVLAERFEAKGIAYADAPVARTRAAAEAGTLSATVGADDATFARIEPYLRCFASDVTRCGPVGAGQVAKLLNNMVLMQTVQALAEALAIARGVGIDGAVLFDALSKGSADSFALRNHGMKAMLPGAFPTRAFACTYAAKDLSYALAMAADAGVAAPGAETVGASLRRAIAEGYGEEYWPAIAKVVGPN